MTPHLLLVSEKHWYFLISSWFIIFRRLLKDDEILEYEDLLELISRKAVSDNLDKWIWSLILRADFQ